MKLLKEQALRFWIVTTGGEIFIDKDRQHFPTYWDPKQAGKRADYLRNKMKLDNVKVEPVMILFNKR